MRCTPLLTFLPVVLSIACATRGGGVRDGGTDAGPCTAGTHSCADGVATACGADHVLRTFECDPVQGMVCEPGGCTGVCSPSSITGSYVGCDYVPTVTINPVWSSFHFAVAVASTSDVDTHVTVTRGADTIDMETVPPHGTTVVQLPWVPELKGADFGPGTQAPDPGDSRLVVGGAYRLRTDQPVTAYQFSPYEYTLGPISTTCPNYDPTHGGCNSYSNDASLLLPKNVLGTSYTVAAWASGSAGPSLYAVTATENGTVVTVTGSGVVRAGGGVDASGNGTVMLEAGDVLEVIGTRAEMPMGFGATYHYGTDLTATRVVSNKPVMVIGGNGCANAPTAGAGYCDHIEEVLFPDVNLGMDYYVTVPNGPATADPHTDIVRVVSTVPGTAVHFDPPVSPDVVLDGATPFVDVAVTADVHVTADHPVMVAQYMVGSSVVEEFTPQGDAQGDPSESLAVPTSRFRRNYQFFVSQTYATSFVNIVAPTGATVTLDGVALPASDFTAVGGAAFGVAHHHLDSIHEVHQLTSDQPVGITVYGYAPYTSFMYPGGLDLVGNLI